MKFYVYLHRRKSDGEVFYVGKGCGKRAWRKSDRSDWWKRIEGKHGRIVEIVHRGLEEEQAFEKEAELVRFYGRESLCNLRDGGSGGCSPSEETRLKMSAAKLGRKVSEETRELHRIASTGRKHSEETKEKIRAANLGKKRGPIPEEIRRKMSLAKKGKHRSPEHCAAISAAKKGIKKGPMSDATKEKLRIASAGRRHTDESKAKLSAAATGRKHSEITREKLTESNRRLNAKRRKPVKCSNGMVFEYSGSAEKWLRENGYPSAYRTNIVSCCTGNLKTAYGFTWQFADDAGK